MSPPIRPRTDSDLASCVAALTTVHRADGYPSRWPDHPRGFLTPEDTLAAWVATRDGRCRGHVLLRDGAGERAEIGDLDVPLPPRLASVSRLFVVSDARGAALGARLLDAAVGEAARRGRDVILSVVDGMPAVGWYERLGWRYLTTRPGTWVLPDGSVPRLRYYRQPAEPPGAQAL